VTQLCDCTETVEVPRIDDAELVEGAENISVPVVSLPQRENAESVPLPEPAAAPAEVVEHAPAAIVPDARAGSDRPPQPETRAVLVQSSLVKKAMAKAGPGLARTKSASSNGSADAKSKGNRKPPLASTAAPPKAGHNTGALLSPSFIDEDLVMTEEVCIYLYC
jgi:hypothetical protein